MMHRTAVLAMTVVALTVLAACGGGSAQTAATTTPPPTTLAPTTTTAVAACPTTFTFGTTHLPQECREQSLAAILQAKNVTVDSTGPVQAAAICRKMITSGTMGMVNTLADWATGTTASPVAEGDQSTFIIMAVAVYCPDHWDELQFRP